MGSKASSVSAERRGVQRVISVRYPHWRGGARAAAAAWGVHRATLYREPSDDLIAAIARVEGIDAATIRSGIPFPADDKKSNPVARQLFSAAAQATDPSDSARLSAAREAVVTGNRPRSWGQDQKATVSGGPFLLNVFDGQGTPERRHSPESVVDRVRRDLNARAAELGMSLLEKLTGDLAGDRILPAGRGDAADD